MEGTDGVSRECDLTRIEMSVKKRETEGMREGQGRQHLCKGVMTTDHAMEAGKRGMKT